MNRWCRLWCGLARDEKLLAAALRCDQPVERVVWLFIAILESAATINEAGRYAIDFDECAYFLRCAPGELSLIHDALEAGGRLADGRVVRWTERQFASDRSAARTAEWRARLARQDHAGKLNGHAHDKVTSRQRHGDAPESEPKEGKEDSVDVTSPELHPEHIVKHWNLLATKIGKPLVRDLTDSRRQLVKARIHQYSVDDFIDAFSKIERSAFLRGDAGWQGCTFDWMIKRGNFQKIIEGNYDH